MKRSGWASQVLRLRLDAPSPIARNQYWTAERQFLALPPQSGGGTHGGKSDGPLQHVTSSVMNGCRRLANSD